MNIEQILIEKVQDAINELYGKSIDCKAIQVQKTNKEFSGDYTIVVFPMLRITKTSPEETAKQLGEWFKMHLDFIEQYNVIKGFLNLCFTSSYWLSVATGLLKKKEQLPEGQNNETVMVEYSSPNTNKPLHLGHIRNNLIGYAISNILNANGSDVIKANLVNDRGIHICKSMLAWQKWSNNETPLSSGKKGDKLVGDYYVMFDQAYKKEVKGLIEKGTPKEEAAKQAPVLKEAQEMLRKWEAGDQETVALWKQMNNWVYEGFDKTYKMLGVDFDKIYYESETYKTGRAIVTEALDKGILFKKDDGSVWANLSEEGLDEKLLLRADGTSVYMTQDIGTAVQRFKEYGLDKIIYVVGNEQDYHFQVLALILKKLGYAWAENIFHLSYGMVNLPSGRMKSREGTVVDADDLVEEMVGTAREMSKELGKLEGYSREEKENIFRIIGMGALKYFILKVDPKKNMTFNPEESIDFNGNTGPFIQYTYARICSLQRKAKDKGMDIPVDMPKTCNLNDKETALIKQLNAFPGVITLSAKTLNPSYIANYIYDVTKEFNQFYQEYPILTNTTQDMNILRMALSLITGRIIKNGMKLLGIDVPERM